MDPSSSSSPKRKRDLDSYDEHKRPKYDVFVNYASEDISNGFASHLKGALGREGFTICDHNELPKGQDKSSELLKAIEDSEIYLAVFSTKYAFSIECLDELVFIMESYLKFKKRKVFPIFFDVDPSHVRNQQGSFLEAFLVHEKNVDPKRVQIWRKALKEAGDKSGLNLKHWRNEDQFIQIIVKDVRKMQNPQQLCDVEHLVGIDSRVQDIISALKLGDQAFFIVAVLGISGSGKTTTVKAVYDRIAAEFDVSCFIQDINSYVYRGSNWKVDLQRDVISCLTGSDKLIASHNDGAAKIKKLISGQKLFLVLDDVYTLLQALSIHSASFHCESRIIVTTRNTQSLSNLQHTSYNIELLDTSESFELFTRLIGKGDPIDKKFVDAIVRCAGGIPLVLEVWSRHFTDYDRNLWPSMLETLKRIPHEDTQKKLRISYDSLPKRAQNLFLDITCFFDGMSKDLIVKVLQDEDFFPDVEIQIQNLVHKFLVFYRHSDLVLLHHVIRKMGQEVVRLENEDEPGKRTRLMGYRDVVRVLGDCSGTDSVRSIRLDYTNRMEEGATVQLEVFKKMSNLRFIKLANPNLQWSSSSNDDMSACFSFKHLKYLEWRYFPCKSLDNIDMGNVVVIKLWKSNLEKLWEGVKCFKKLKILDVSNSRSLTKIGNFDGLENLEEVNLSWCQNLEELDSSIGCLQKLVELDLSKCTGLKRLPWEMIGKLTSLQNLNLHHCDILEELDSSIGCLQKLVELDLSKCTQLKRLPWEMIGKLTSLQKLNLRHCDNLEELDSSIGCLQKLIKLDLRYCSRLKRLPWEMIGNLTSLKCLSLKNCSNLLEISHEIGSLISLKHLGLSNTRFNNLPNSICQLHQLTKIILSHCTNLNSIPDLPPSIEELAATQCINLVNLPSNCSELQFLTRLDLDNCSKLGSEGFTQVTGLRNLCQLRMEKCNVSQVSNRIGNLVSLRELYLAKNTFSSLPESFSNLSKLEELHINYCSQLQLLPPLPSQLTFIDAKWCGSLDVMPFDSMQSAYIFPSKIFKESRLMSNEGLHIGLWGKELPEWCTYRKSGDVLCFVSPIQFDSNICGLIFCATGVKDAKYRKWGCPTIHNKTKGTSHRFRGCRHVWVSMLVMFYPLNDTTIVVEAGDTLKVEFNEDEESAKSVGLRLVYEDDVVDSGLVLKDVRKPTHSQRS